MHANTQQSTIATHAHRRKTPGCRASYAGSMNQITTNQHAAEKIIGVSSPWLGLGLGFGFGLGLGSGLGFELGSGLGLTLLRLGLET